MNTYTIQAQLNLEFASQLASNTAFNPSRVTVTLDIEADSQEEAIDQADNIIENQTYLSLLDPHVTNIVRHTTVNSGYTSLTSLLNQVAQTSVNPASTSNSSYTRLT